MIFSFFRDKSTLYYGKQISWKGRLRMHMVILGIAMIIFGVVLVMKGSSN